MGSDLDLFSWQDRRREESKRREAQRESTGSAKGGSSKAEPPATAPETVGSPGTPTKEPGPTVLTVTQINNLAKNRLEREFDCVTVVGEVSNYKDHTSGHRYFSLKDRSSQLSVVLFRREAQRLKFRLQNGLEVVATGKLTIYPQGGRYQMVLERVEPRGAGALQAAFEQLKARLGQEGLFDPERKRPLPHLPRRVAVVTSPAGAVIRDIVHVATRRFPNAQILLVPTPTQGADSARSVAWAIKRAVRLADEMQIDAIIVARGGGSLEDLWGFNEEIVARAVADCPIPVVSAVGHETDFTICDFVADVRAPTPSAAAELLFPVRSELAAMLNASVERARRAVHRNVERNRHRIERSRATIGDGRDLTRDGVQRLIELQHRLQDSTRRRVRNERERLNDAHTRIASHHPRTQLGRLSARIEEGRRRSQRALAARIERERDRLKVADRLAVDIRATHQRELQRLHSLGQRLDALSPLKVLDRGYGIVFGPDGAAVRSADEVRPGDALRVRVARGEIHAHVDDDED